MYRFANRVPLQYQQSACSSFKAVAETSWRNYGLQQPRGSMPAGPIVFMIHMASVWVPFTSESKEAIADYDEIRKEMKLALQDCGRKLGSYLRRRQRMKREGERRSIFLRYIGEIAKACNGITGTDTEALYDALMSTAQRKTAEFDVVLDQDGKVVDDGGRLAGDDAVFLRQDSAPKDDGDDRDDGDNDDDGVAADDASDDGDTPRDTLFGNEEDEEPREEPSDAPTRKKRVVKKKVKKKVRRRSEGGN